MYSTNLAHPVDVYDKCTFIKWLFVAYGVHFIFLSNRVSIEFQFMFPLRCQNIVIIYTSLFTSFLNLT